jgi:hypothetical protein
VRSTAFIARPRGRARRLRIALTAVVLGAVAASGAVATTPAEATTASPRITLVGGDRAITAAWSAVPGATSYTLRMSKSRSLSHARTVTTTKRTMKLTAANGTPYFFSVTAKRPTVTPAITVRTAVATAKAAAGVPLPVAKVTATPGPGRDQVTVSWTGGGRASKVAVVAGSDVITNQRSFHSAWYPATTRSITITVPAAYRSYIGAGTGNPVWVKVVQSNSRSTAFGPSYSYARKYRPSPVGTWSFAADGQQDAPVSRLTVAELNTQSVGATAGYSAANRWAQRAGRVAAAINTTSPAPDLLMTAELATNVLDGCANTFKDPYRCRSHTQVADLASRLDHLALADTDAYDRVLDRMRDSERWMTNVTNGAHVFYNPDALTLLDHGFYAPAMSPSDDFANVEGLGVSPWDPKSAIGADRWLTWAKFETKDGSGRRFYALAAHFPVGGAQSVVDARAELATKLVDAIDRRAGGLPVVFGGDLNTDATRSAKPVQPVFIADGWFDAAAVSSKSLRTGMKVSTANGSGEQGGADPGYGPRPVIHPYETSRIDYILLKNSPHTYRYANVLRLHPDGSFIASLQGTDHNMQLATIGIGDPVQ